MSLGPARYTNERSLTCGVFDQDPFMPAYTSFLAILHRYMLLINPSTLSIDSQFIASLTLQAATAVVFGSKPICQLVSEGRC